VPAGHTLAHFPDAHASVVAHVTLQPPQLVGSAFVCTHDEPHRTSPCSHAKSHALCTQTAMPNAGTLHEWPQAPQFAGSLVVSMQPWPQSDLGGEHSVAQTPFAQAAVPN
jgi:hypothetical protein